MRRPAALVLGLLLAATAARADYTLEPTEDRFVIVADSWKLDGENLDVTVGETKLRLPIKVFWLADRIDSGSICCGEHQQRMKAYLEKIAKLEKTSLLVEVVSTKKDANAHFVAGIWPLEAKPLYQTACELGSSLLDMKPEDAKKLGSAAAFEAKLRARSDADGPKLAKKRVKP